MRGSADLHATDIQCCFFRVCYIEKSIYHFLKMPKSSGGLTRNASEALNLLFSALLAPDLPSYNYGLVLLQVSYKQMSYRYMYNYCNCRISSLK